MQATTTLKAPSCFQDTHRYQHLPQNTCFPLQRALGVLGHQRRYLKEHKAGLEKWTAAVYGVSLSTEAFGSTETASTAIGEREKRDPQHLLGSSKTVMREVRVSLKCKGAKRRMDKHTLIAYVDQTWSPRHDHLKSGKKRTSGKTEAEKPAKRGKPPAPKGAQAIVIGTSSVAGNSEEITQDDPSIRKSDEVPDVPGASDQAWTWLDDGTSFRCVSGRQPPAEDEAFEVENHVRRSSVPLRADETKTATEPGAFLVIRIKCVWPESLHHTPVYLRNVCPSTIEYRRGFTLLSIAHNTFARFTGNRCDHLKDDADVLRQRLVQALAAPAVVKDLKSGMQSKSYPEATMRTPSGTDAVHLLDVTQLSHAQRVLVQLTCAGLLASTPNRGPLCVHPAGRDLP